ncbi:multiple myeloma tumor-associated protein homolog [Trichophyton mentagrophytes]|nr:multiple myeloma tumor-associated protein homolog [Trichophyton mentagrophytes]
MTDFTGSSGEVSSFNFLKNELKNEPGKALKAKATTEAPETRVSKKGKTWQRLRLLLYVASMDLVSTIRKEGSRGGQTEFKWSDVKDSSRRENYLGHSLMAPVGRWQQGRDLSWYTKGEDSDAAKKAREEEIRKVKEAEQEAIARALGLPVSVPSKSSNANLEPLGGKDVERAVLEGADDHEDVDRVKGVGFGGFTGKTPVGEVIEKLEPIGDVSSNYKQTAKTNADSRPRKVGEKTTAQIDMKGKDIVLGPERPLGGNAQLRVHAAEIGKHEIVKAIADGADPPMAPNIIETIKDMNVTTEDKNTTQI